MADPNQMPAVDSSEDGRRKSTRKRKALFDISDLTSEGEECAPGVAKNDHRNQAYFSLVERCFECATLRKGVKFCRLQKCHTGPDIGACCTCSQQSLTPTQCRNVLKHKAPNSRKPSAVITKDDDDFDKMLQDYGLPPACKIFDTIQVEAVDMRGCTIGSSSDTEKCQPDSRKISRNPSDYAVGYMPFAKEAWQRFLHNFFLQTGTKYSTAHVSQKRAHRLHTGRIGSEFVSYKVSSYEILKCHRGGEPRIRRSEENTGTKRRAGARSQKIGCPSVMFVRRLEVTGHGEYVEVTLPKLSSHTCIDSRVLEHLKERKCTGTLTELEQKATELLVVQQLRGTQFYDALSDYVRHQLIPHHLSSGVLLAPPLPDDRRYFLSKKDLDNLTRRILSQSQQQTLFVKDEVLKLIQAERNANPEIKIYFATNDEPMSRNPQNEPADPDQNMNSSKPAEPVAPGGAKQTDFLLVLQTPAQQTLLQQFGQSVICISPIHTCTRCCFPCYFLFVQAPSGECYTVASVMTLTQVVNTLQEALTILVSWNRRWSPAYLLMDKHTHDMKAVHQVFPRAQILVSDYHRELAQTKWLNTCNLGDITSDVKSLISEVFEKLAHAHTDEKYAEILQSLDAHHWFKKDQPFHTYLHEEWLCCKPLWCHSQRSNLHTQIDVVKLKSSLIKFHKQHLNVFKHATVSSLLFILLESIFPQEESEVQHTLHLELTKQKNSPSVPSWLQTQPEEKQTLYQLQIQRGRCVAEKTITELVDRKYRVTFPTGEFTVDVNGGCCTCPIFQLQHVPCQHIFAVIENTALTLNDLPASVWSAHQGRRRFVRNDTSGTRKQCNENLTQSLHEQCNETVTQSSQESQSTDTEIVRKLRQDINLMWNQLYTISTQVNDVEILQDILKQQQCLQRYIASRLSNSNNMSHNAAFPDNQVKMAQLVQAAEQSRNLPPLPASYMVQNQLSTLVNNAQTNFSLPSSHALHVAPINPSPATAPLISDPLQVPVSTFSGSTGIAPSVDTPGLDCHEVIVSTREHPVDHNVVQFNTNDVVQVGSNSMEQLNAQLLVILNQAIASNEQAANK